MKKNKILYWPGRGQDLNILKDLRDSLIKEGFECESIKCKYDMGNLEPSNWEQVSNNDAEWWIGISLGASLLYYSLKYTGVNKPKRITLINPFYSREILSKERNFDLQNQWSFDPINCKVKIKYLDMILSINDTKIPMYHGIKLLNNTSCKRKQIIFVNENHTIDNKDAQIELMRILKNKYYLKRGKNDERYNYCNVYKQIRN